MLVLEDHLDEVSRSEGARDPAFGDGEFSFLSSGSHAIIPTSTLRSSGSCEQMPRTSSLAATDSQSSIPQTSSIYNYCTLSFFLLSSTMITHRFQSRVSQHSCTLASSFRGARSDEGGSFVAIGAEKTSRAQDSEEVERWPKPWNKKGDDASNQQRQP